MFAIARFEPRFPATIGRMYAQCPECLTIYSLDTATLAQAQGDVGCGQCGATFNALATLAEALPEDDFEILPVHPNSPAPPILMMAVVHDAPPQHPLFEDTASRTGETGAADEESVATEAAVPTTTSSTGNNEAEETAATASPLPSFVVHRRRAPDTPRHRLAWILGCLVLVLVLGIQLAWAERVPLTANPATRPWLAQVCHWFGCRLPAVRDLADLQLLSRDVRPHPNVPGALLISATVRNNAAFTQPYPVVSITLSDLDENRIAMRRFRPATYIPDAKVRAAGLAPGATAALMFEVKDPGRHAVAFQFGFQ